MPFYPYLAFCDLMKLQGHTILTLSGLQKRLQEASDDTKKMREDSSTAVS